MESLPARQFAFVLAHVERLADRGNQLRMPASPAVASCVDHVPQATTERARGVQRARDAIARCIAEGHTAEEDS
jgi:hypothetical protein